MWLADIADIDHFINHDACKGKILGRKTGGRPSTWYGLKQLAEVTT